MAEKRCYTVKELQDIFGVSRPTVYNDNRRKNAELFEEAFYEKKDLNPQMHSDTQTNTLKIPEGVDAEMLQRYWQIQR